MGSTTPVEVLVLVVVLVTVFALFLLIFGVFLFDVELPRSLTKLVALLA
jgi:hypothetical protein